MVCHHRTNRRRTQSRARCVNSPVFNLSGTAVTTHSTQTLTWGLTWKLSLVPQNKLSVTTWKSRSDSIESQLCQHLKTEFSLSGTNGKHSFHQKLPVNSHETTICTALKQMGRITVLSSCQSVQSSIRYRESNTRSNGAWIPSATLLNAQFWPRWSYKPQFWPGLAPQPDTDGGGNKQLWPLDYLSSSLVLPCDYLPISIVLPCDYLLLAL